MDLTEFRPFGWTLIGGQMVHLLAWEHGEESPRPTTDADVVVDVRLVHTAMHDITAKLVEIGFELDGITPDNIGHRYVHTRSPKTKIDVLVIEGVNAERYRTSSGATSPTWPPSLPGTIRSASFTTA